MCIIYSEESIHSMLQKDRTFKIAREPLLSLNLEKSAPGGIFGNKNVTPKWDWSDSNMGRLIKHLNDKLVRLWKWTTFLKQRWNLF